VTKLLSNAVNEIGLNGVFESCAHTFFNQEQMHQYEIQLWKAGRIGSWCFPPAFVVHEVLVHMIGTFIIEFLDGRPPEELIFPLQIIAWYVKRSRHVNRTSGYVMSKSPSFLSGCAHVQYGVDALLHGVIRGLVQTKWNSLKSLPADKIWHEMFYDIPLSELCNLGDLEFLHDCYHGMGHAFFFVIAHEANGSVLQNASRSSALPLCQPLVDFDDDMLNVGFALCAAAPKSAVGSCLGGLLHSYRRHSRTSKHALLLVGTTAGDGPKAEYFYDDRFRASFSYAGSTHEVQMKTRC